MNLYTSSCNPHSSTSLVWRKQKWTGQGVESIPTNTNHWRIPLHKWDLSETMETESNLITALLWYCCYRSTNRLYFQKCQCWLTVSWINILYSLTGVNLIYLTERRNLSLLQKVCSTISNCTYLHTSIHGDLMDMNKSQSIFGYVY